MKKEIIGLAVVMWMFAGANAWALDYTYTNSSGKVTITGYTGSGGDIVIPETIEGLPVVSISSYAFQNRDSITSHNSF